MAGYSATPLVKKLGFKPGFRAGLVNSPPGSKRNSLPIPDDVNLAVDKLSQELDLIILFVDSQKSLNREFSLLARKLVTNGMLWIAWPKRASGVVTDLSEGIVRNIGLEAGLVDVKVCAINEVWSGLKFVYRLNDRKSR